MHLETYYDVSLASIGFRKSCNYIFSGAVSKCLSGAVSKYCSGDEWKCLSGAMSKCLSGAMSKCLSGAMSKYFSGAVWNAFQVSCPIIFQVPCQTSLKVLYRLRRCILLSILSIHDIIREDCIEYILFSWYSLQHEFLQLDMK